ncbi:hypothetical protein SAMN05216499_1584 [Actinacidiphila paucisporea]|uniref:Uncharacterized protein n=1 Tax=Actinacidiphila paucisporea TaxID=310782 RepID=A0A1M7R0A6_9ACTN|nr:hypothetical protein SAMN05216499_1584 [Actinacidiphila paucisporea]
MPHGPDQTEENRPARPPSRYGRTVGAMRAIVWRRRDVARMNRRLKADGALSSIDGSLARLGTNQRVSSAFRVAYRRWLWAEPKVRALKVLYWVFFVSTLRRTLFTDPEEYFKPHADPSLVGFYRDSWKQFHGLPTGLAGIYIGLLFPFAILISLIGVAQIAAPVAGPFAPLGYAYVLRKNPRAAVSALAMHQRYRPLAIFAASIESCARAATASTERRPARLLAMSTRLDEVARAVRRAHRTRGAVPFRSHRRRILKRHAGLVVAALRAAEGKIDSAPESALPNLAELVLRISENYIGGRIGQLLDDADLQGLEPVADREPLRIIAAACICGGTAVGISFTALPDEAKTYLIGVGGVIGLTIIYGRNARRAFDILATLRGN